MSKVSLIIQREYLTRVKKKSFILMTILGPLLMAGLGIGAMYISLGIEEDQNVLVCDPLSLLDDLQDIETVKFDHRKLTLDSAKGEFLRTDFTALIYIPPSIYAGETAAVQLFYKKKPGAFAFKHFRRELEDKIEAYKIKDKSINPIIYRSIKTDVELKEVSFKEEGKEQEEYSEAGLIGFAFSVLVYIFIFMYGVQVMRGVIEEKTNRIIEVIISSVKPFQLMMGKIIGIALVGLTQFLLWIILTGSITSIGLSFAGDEYQEMAQDRLENMTPQLQEQEKSENVNIDKFWKIIDRVNFPLILGCFLIYFLGGYLLYASLFAAVGAAVDNETDSQQFIVPITMPLILAYLVGFAVIQNPEGPAAFWFSIIPFTSPVIMMVRVASVPFDVIMWELLLSIVLLVAGFVFTTWMAAKIYRTGILMYGKKVNYKELWKWIRYS